MIKCPRLKNLRLISYYDSSGNEAMAQLAHGED
jgi:hypothetical protein